LLERTINFGRTDESTPKYWVSHKLKCGKMCLHIIGK
jgi:hypothetical protein